MSGHWAWFPPQVHLNTGRLCSAGSGCHAVPRRQRSYAALRRPAPFSHDSGSPRPWPPSMRALVLCLEGRRHVRLHTCRASETGHRLSAKPAWVEERRGPPRLRGRPLPACHRRTPRRRRLSPRPTDAEDVVAFASSSTLGLREDERLRGRNPMARTCACRRFSHPLSGIGARRASSSGGLPLGWAGFPPAEIGRAHV